jgi:hypothetical protein
MNMETEQVKVYPFERGLSPVTSKLVDLLKVGKPNDKLTDEEMSAHCGRDTRVGGNGYGNLGTAIGRTEKFYGIVWKRVLAENCIVCLTDEGKMSVVQDSTVSIHRKARRAIRVGGLVDINNIPEDKRSGFLVTAAQVGATELMTRTTTARKLLARGVIKTPDISLMLEAFKQIN